MPPKAAPAKKTDDKKKQKIIEDKTFGLKNKNKSKAVQKYVAAVSQQVKGGGSDKRAEMERAKRKAEEKDAEERARMERELFKPVVVQQKVPVGVDPKSIVCEFFKKGQCTKGDKCKFSHDLGASRKTEKIDLYTDQREIDEDEAKKADVMENWSQEKLETVVDQKRSDVNRNLKTKIICKFFLDAVELRKYGWFWECPNGPTCIYQHCLPPGFVLKDRTKKEDEEEDDEEGPTLEEEIEDERKKLATRTPLTLEIFLKWKEEKKALKEASEREAAIKREQDIKAGKILRSGRDLFTYDPTLFVDDEGAFDASELPPEEEEVDDRPILRIDATATSISFTPVTQYGEETSIDSNGKDEVTDADVDRAAMEVQESLFVEDDIPDDDEDDEDDDDDEEDAS